MEQWDNYDEYMEPFEFEDIKDMVPDGEAHKAFLKDLEKEPGFGTYKEPTDKELDELIRNLQIGNLDLPSEQDLIKQAEESINRHLYPSEIDKIKNVKKKMDKIAGKGSYNESAIIKTEGSDGNYMTTQNLETIFQGTKEIMDKIDIENIPDWVQDKISKITENIRALKDYYNSSRNEKGN